MSEYVKKDDLLLSFCEYCDSHVVGCDDCPIKAAIAEIPVVDAVPVVRCGECENTMECKSDQVYCTKHGRFYGLDYYCADGERKEEDNGEEY